MNIVEKICLNGQEVKDNACWHLKIMGECFNLVFHTQVFIEGIIVKVADLRDIPLYSRVVKRCDNDDFY